MFVFRCATSGKHDTSWRNFRADQAEAELARLIPADHPENLFRRLCEGLLQADNQCQQLDAELKEARDKCQRLKDRLVPSLVLKSGQKCSFEEVILPCLRERPTISRPVRSVVLEDGYLVNEYQLRNLEAVLRYLVVSVSGLQFVLIRTKRPDARGQQLDEAQRMEEKRRHMEELEEMLLRLKESSQVVFKLKYVDAMHDRKMLFDNGWAVHMGKGLDFIRQPKWGPVYASTEYPCHDVGEASINFSYNWAEDVINYVEAIVQRDVEKFDLIV